MTYQAVKDDRISGGQITVPAAIRTPGVARQLPANDASSNTALTVSCRRISILAMSADLRYEIGTGSQTAYPGDSGSGDSHFIKQNERIELDVPLKANIAVIRDASTNGELEVTEFLNP